MQNRRNFYRILQVQPDAPLDVIKNNYRTLLQKLRLHPDLGGDQHNASLINQAWQTLRDPVRRRAYDKQLLQDYHIHVLSQGHLAGNSKENTYNSRHQNSRETNQRNYYRILNVQTDASTAIITASYRLQLKNLHVPLALLQEAYQVLSDPQKRNHYDKLLKNHSHIQALQKKKSECGKPPAIVDKMIADSPFSSTNAVIRNHACYQPIINHFCHFCKTPHNVDISKYCSQLCIECASPLGNLPDDFGESLQRRLARIDKAGKLEIFLDWPAQGHYGTLTNLSPGGLGFTTRQPIRSGQVIKIDSEHFKCIAKVTYCKNIASGTSIGSSFITVLFDRQQGTFISTQA